MPATKEKKSDKVYRELTEKVIELMESDPQGWMKPWVGGGFMRPQNAVSKHYFTGGNFMLLSILAMLGNYDNSLWATYKQWESIGAQVRKGEKGIGLIRVGSSLHCPEKGCGWRSSARGDRCPRHGKVARRMFPVGFTVFHASQVDGYEAPKPQTFDHDPIDHAESFFEAVGATVVDGPDAYYVPAQDVITLPPLERFRRAEGYYSTRAHETVHWTGHESRLDRGLTSTSEPLIFGNEKYAREELVAELGSVFLMAHLGLEAEPRGDHAAYLKSWLKKLRDDVTFLWSAASDAEKAVKYIIEAAESGEKEQAA